MSRYTWRPGSDDPLASCHGYRHDYRHHHRSTTGSPYCGRSCCGYRRPSCGICGTPFPQQIPPYVSTAGGAGVGVCPSWRRRRVDHGAWAAVGEGVPEVGLSGAPVTATPKRRRRTHPCSWRGQLLVVLLGCSPYCRAFVRALAHVTGALTAVIRCPDGSRHGQTGGVAWRRGGVYDSLPQHRRAALMSFSPLRAPAAASPTSGQVDTTPDHRGFVPARGCPRLAGLAGRGRQGSRVFLGVIARLVVGEWGRRCGCPTAAGGFAPGPRSR